MFHTDIKSSYKNCKKYIQHKLNLNINLPVLLLKLAVWLSGNALASINVVAPRQTRLVLG